MIEIVIIGRLSGAVALAGVEAEDMKEGAGQYNKHAYYIGGTGLRYRELC